MNDVQVVIPYLVHLWALEDCIESHGNSRVPVLIVDNSLTQDAAGREWPDNVRVAAQRSNIGIAASWNLGLAEGAEQTIVMSQWVRLAPAEYPRRTEPWGLDYLAAGTVRHATRYGCTFAEQGFHLISIGRALVEAIGLFDEALFAYGEDDDYRHRMDLADLGGAMGSWPSPAHVFSIGYGIAKRTPGAIDRSREDSMTSGVYWQLKWGTTGSDQPGGYRTPFGNPDHPLSFWPVVR